MKSFVPLSKKRSAVALYARKLEINGVIDGKAQKILVMSKDDVGDILQIIRLLKNFYRNIKSYNTYYCHQNKETEICIHKYTSCCIRSQSIRKSHIKWIHGKIYRKSFFNQSKELFKPFRIFNTISSIS